MKIKGICMFVKFFINLLFLNRFRFAGKLQIVQSLHVQHTHEIANQ